MPRDSATPFGFNPVLSEKRFALSNLLQAFRARPLISLLAGTLGLFALWLALLSMFAFVDEHQASLWHSIERWPLACWVAVVMACLSSQLPALRRTTRQADSGWLAALPQMPRAGRRYCLWRSLIIALLQVFVLVTASLSLKPTSPGNGYWALHLAMASMVPFMCWLVLPLLARPPTSPIQQHPLIARAVPSSRESTGSVLRHWQWAHYLHHRWSTGARWSLGFCALLITANAGVLEVVAVLLTGVILIQWHQYWTSSLNVVVQASAVTAALAVKPRPFLQQLIGLVTAGALALPGLIFLLLFALGVDGIAAALIALSTFALLTLHAAVVFAWRRQPKHLTLRSALILLMQIVLSQSLPPAAPIIWLCVLSWLVRKALKEDS